MSKASLGGVIYMLQAKLDHMKGEIEPAKNKIEAAHSNVRLAEQQQVGLHDNLASLERAIGILEGVEHASGV